MSRFCATPCFMPLNHHTRPTGGLVDRVATGPLFARTGASNAVTRAVGGVSWAATVTTRTNTSNGVGCSHEY